MNAETTDAGADHESNRLQELHRQIGELRDREMNRSAYRLSREALRLARSESKLIDYLWANFQVMNLAQTLLLPKECREAAIESIAFFESETKPRAFQADYNEEHYQYVVHRMTSCAYDNLATATAMAEGFNSSGTHDCIGEGIQVCRRTGKLECVTCFREYATDVHLSSDDLPMALHYATQVATQPPVNPSNDRRWVGASDIGRIHLVEGKLHSAIEAFMKAWDLTDSYHSPETAKRRTFTNLELASLLAGVDNPLEQALRYQQAPLPNAPLPPGENPAAEFNQATNEAVRAVLAGDYERALDLLTPGEHYSTEQGCLSRWLDIRLQMIAICRLAGKSEQMHRLARSVEAKAKPARDWFTLRYLKRVLDDQATICPAVILNDVTVGPFASKGVHSVPVELAIAASNSTATTTAAVAAESATAETEAPSPKMLQLRALIERISQAMQADEEATALDLQASFQELRQLMSEPATRWEEVAEALFVMRVLAAQTILPDDTWNWVQQLVQPFANQSTILNIHADLAYALRSNEASPFAEQITIKQVSDLFRQSLDQDPENLANHLRAGNFFANEEMIGEAERCFARAFRLDRTDGYAAARLADIYRHTERPRDGLEVLDLCIRESAVNPDPRILWQASQLARQLEQYERMVTYLDRFEEVEPNQPWTQYFRALGFYELDQPEDALTALRLDRERHDHRHFAGMVLRVCCMGKLDHQEPPQDFIGELEELLLYPLQTVDDLTLDGLNQALTRLWHITSKRLLADSSTRQNLEKLLLATGLLPSAYFEERRALAEATDVNYYICLLRQPLDERWSKSSGCLYGQQHWSEYAIQYGILAPDEVTARDLALSFQLSAYHLPAEVLDIHLQGEDFQDKPGIVWQSFHLQPQHDEEENADEA